MLNAFAKKSSGSIRHHADFSIDSTDIVLKDDVVTSDKKEQRKLSISSMSTADAHHDMSAGNILMNVSPARQHRNNMTLSPVTSVDMRGKHIHAFRSYDDDSLSSMSAVPGLDQDFVMSDHGEEYDQLGVEDKREERHLYSDSERLGGHHMVVSDVNDGDSDVMSHDSMQETLENLVFMDETEAQQSTRSSGEGKRSLPFTYSFSSSSSSEGESGGRDSWKQQSVTPVSLPEETSGHLSSSDANNLRWQIPSPSSSSSSAVSGGGIPSTSHERVVAQSTHSSSIMQTSPTSSTFDTMTSDEKASKSTTVVEQNTTTSKLFGAVSQRMDLSGDSGHEDMDVSKGNEVTSDRESEEVKDIIDKSDQSEKFEVANDDASEITMEWESLVNKLNVVSSSNALGGENVSLFSSVDSSSLFVSDTDNNQAPENYIDNESDGDDGEEDFTLTVQSVTSSTSDHLTLKSTRTYETIRSSSGANIVSHRSNVSSSTATATATATSSRVTSTTYSATASSSTLSSTDSSQVVQSSRDFISKYHLEGVISDDLSSSSSTVPSAHAASNVSTYSNTENDKDRGIVSDDVSSRLSTGSDAFNLRLSILSNSSSSDDDNDHDDNADDSQIERIFEKHQRRVTTSSSVGTGASSTAEVTATVRTARAVQDVNSWLQEPSFSVASSNDSSDEDWKKELSKSYLSASAGASASASAVATSTGAGAVGTIPARKQDSDTGSDTLQQQRSVLANMDIFFSDSDSEIEGVGLTRSSVSLTVGPVADISSTTDSDDLFGEMGLDTSRNVGSKRATAKSTVSEDDKEKPYNLSDGSVEEEEDSTDRILAAWSGPRSPAQGTHREGVRERGLLSSSSGSGSTSSSDEVDHVQALQQMINDQSELNASNSSDSSRDIIHAGDEDEKDGETSLGELLGFSDNSTFSLTDDMS